MKPKFIKLFMSIAETVAQMSHAERLKVGSIVVKDDRVISMGYNGMPAGWDNTCEFKEYTLCQPAGFLDEDGSSYNLKTKPEVLHAETNAIAKLARSSESGLDSDLFVTHSPCLDCAKLIYQAGIRRVYYGSAYRSSDGINFLKASNVDVIQVEKGS